MIKGKMIVELRKDMIDISKAQNPWQIIEYRYWRAWKKPLRFPAAALESELPVLTVVTLFISKGRQRISVVSLITFQMPGMFAIWPVDNLFAFVDGFAAGITFTCEPGCDLAGISGITVKIVHWFWFYCKWKTIPVTRDGSIEWMVLLKGWVFQDRL